MIKNSLLAFAFIFIVFSLFIFFNKTEWHSIQYQYQGNLIKTQKYLYNESPTDAVIIGTSLSARLLTDSLPGVYNLALAGLNVFDGMYIINEKKIKPKVVFVEMNYFFRPESKEYIGAFNSKVYNVIKEEVPAFREENQPIGIVMHYIKHGLKPAAVAAAPSRSKRSIPDDVFNELLSNYLKSYNIVDTTLIRKSTDKLYTYVKDLTTAGIKVYFYEVPVNRELEELPFARATRSAIAQKFQGEQNVFIIAKPSDDSYETLDGVHLDDAGLYNYTLYLKNAVEQLPSHMFSKS
jgi:hypothetical protein